MCTLWRPIRILVDLCYISARSLVRPVDSLSKTIVLYYCGKRWLDRWFVLGFITKCRIYNNSSTQFLLITICELMLWRDLIGRSEKLDFALAFCYCNTCIWIVSSRFLRFWWILSFHLKSWCFMHFKLLVV